MYRHILLLIICMNLLPLYIFAQSKWKPGALPEVGIMAGSYEPSGDARATFLLAKNSWSVGLGAGIDWYRFRSVPVYAQGRKTFGQKKNKPFVLASGGVNLPTKEPVQEAPIFWPGIRLIDSWAPPVKTAEPGWYAEAGAGYGFFNKKQRGLTLSLNWVYKSRTEWYETDAPAIANSNSKDRTTTTYLMNRLAFRLGWKF